MPGKNRMYSIFNQSGKGLKQTQTPEPQLLIKKSKKLCI